MPPPQVEANDVSHGIGTTIFPQFRLYIGLKPSCFCASVLTRAYSAALCIYSIDSRTAERVESGLGITAHSEERQSGFNEVLRGREDTSCTVRKVCRKRHGCAELFRHDPQRVRARPTNYFSVS